MKITMIGASGAGKTSFMSSLYESLGTNQISGFNITPGGFGLNESLVNIGNFESISFSSRNFKFPSGTTKSTTWSFDLRFHEKFICSYDWIDYRGNLLTSAKREQLITPEQKQEEMNELVSHIVLSNAVILFADSYLLTHYSDINDTRSHTGIDVINDVLTSFNNFLPNHNLTFVIVLTKIDLLDEMWKQNNYAPLIKKGLEAFAPIVEISRKNPSWVGGIIPVSAIGEGNAKSTFTEKQGSIFIETNLTKFPQPLNTSDVLFFCLGNTLLRLREQSISKVEQYEKDIQKTLKQSSIGNDLWSFITRKTSAKDIAQELLESRTKEYLGLRQFDAFIDPLYATALKTIQHI